VIQIDSLFDFWSDHYNKPSTEICLVLKFSLKMGMVRTRQNVLV